MRKAMFIAAVLGVTAGAAVVACSDDDTTAAPVADAGGGDTNAPPADAGGGADTGNDGGTTATLSVVKAFDAKQYELAEGLVVHGGAAYVGLAPLGKVLKIDSSGNAEPYATIPPGYNDGYTLGLAFDANDDLFVLATKNVADAGVSPGVYKLPPSADGGVRTATAPFASDARITFPNGIDFDAAGNLYVADSAIGAVFEITPSGTVTSWKEDPELQGSTACNAPLPFPIGANGIVMTPGAAFVSNTSKGSIVRIAINGDGSAGAVTPVVKDCQYAGFDGIALDKDGSLLAAINGLGNGGRLVRVSAAGAVTVLHAGAPLDGPASVAIADGWLGGRHVLVTSSAFFSIAVDGGAPAPGLLRYGPLP